MKFIKKKMFLVKSEQNVYSLQRVNKINLSQLQTKNNTNFYIKIFIY